MMRLIPGTRVGQYEISSLLGVGGMGEVYRARDTKLNRDVALKVLPAAFASDPDRLARFRREAHVLASLNHPHIAGIYGFEENGTRALVLELVEGPTLADRVARGPIPFDEALPIARQIADALAAAHDVGIVHRDLKPANIKLKEMSGQVKVLDFGLAKAMDTKAAEDVASVGSTMTAMTEMGLILGTAAYMSPEQARGRPVDKRTDIWAFGCVLFEMLTAQPVFGGESVTETLARILEREPDLAKLPPMTPPSIRRLLRRCLEKDRQKRLPDVGVAQIEIDEALAPSHTGEPRALSEQPRLGRERLFWGAGLVATAIVATAAGWFLRPAPAVPPEVRLQINTPPGNPGYFAISPDGRSVVFQATTQGQTRLWIRPMSAETAKVIEGTGGATYPFWSPDNRTIGFFADQKLKRIDVAGGAARTLADAPFGANGAAWGRDGTILFVPANGTGLQRLNGDGGEPAAVTHVEPPRELAHRFPHFLPDGRHFVYWVSGTPDVNGVHAGELASGRTKRLLDADMLAGVAAPDYVLFVRKQTLIAQRIDLQTLTLTGDPVTVAEQVENEPSMEFRAAVSASPSGPLGYRSPATTRRQIAWFDRQGRQTAVVGEFETAPTALAIRVSPDGKTVGFLRRVDGQSDIWLMDLARGTLRRFTSDRAGDGVPVWSSDGTTVAFETNRRGVRDLFRRPVSGVGAEQVLLESPENKNLSDQSSDGRFILYSVLGAAAARDLWALPIAGDRKPIPVAQGPYEESTGRFSPDGRWISYQSNETGRNEIYVRSFPDPGSPIRISTAGGSGAHWRKDGREIIYLAPDRRLMAVPMALPAAGRTLDVGAPVPLFVLPPDTGFDLSPDGQRFLVNTAVGENSVPPITILLNWHGARGGAR